MHLWGAQKITITPGMGGDQMGLKWWLVNISFTEALWLLCARYSTKKSKKPLMSGFLGFGRV